jgi:cytochrome P450
MAPPSDLTHAPPGPRLQRHLLGSWWVLREHDLLERCRRRYGDVFSLNAWPFGLLVVICDPAEIKRAFTADSSQLRAGEGNSVLERIVGPQSVLLLDTDEHLHRRKLMLPPFHGERISVYGELMREIADAEIDRWPLNTPFASHTSMQTITLRVILRAVFGIEDAVKMVELERLLPKLLGSPALMWPFLQVDLGKHSTWGRFLATRDAVDRILFDEIARRRTDPGLDQRSDVLSMLVEAHDEHGEQMSDVELRDQLMTLLLAGHETTATALAWTLERLTRNPRVLSRLRESLVKEQDDYLECVIKESMRSRPVVSYAMRYVTEPFEVGGYTAPAGAFLGTSIILAHSHPTQYPEPEEFRPERFADKRTDTYSWVPFGGGVRRCLGASFAMYEMKIVLRRVLERCELSAPSHKPERPKRRLVTFVPANGAQIVLGKRADAQHWSST